MEHDKEMSPKPAPRPDPDAEWWTMAEIAAYLGLPLKTIHTYRFRGQRGMSGGLLQEDKKIGRTPVWRPARVIHWNEEERPGQGAGGGRPRKGRVDE